MEFQSAGTYNIVRAPEDFERAVGQDFRNIVGSQRLGADAGRVDEQAAVAIGCDAHARECRVGGSRFCAAQSAQRDVRERFRHAVGAPHGIGKRAQQAFQLLAHRAAADNQALDAAQQAARAGQAQAFVYLHRGHGGEMRGFVQVFQRVGARRDGHKAQAAHERPHCQHLTRDVTQRQAEQSRLSGLEIKETARGERTGTHTALFHYQLFRAARRARRLHAQGGAGAVPFGRKAVQLLAEGALLGGIVEQPLALDAKIYPRIIFHEQLTRAKALRQRGEVGRELGQQMRHPLREGVEPHVALQGTRHPKADIAPQRRVHPLRRARKAAVERGFQHDVLRAYLVEQIFFFFLVINAD